MFNLSLLPSPSLRDFTIPATARWVASARKRAHPSVRALTGCRSAAAAQRSMCVSLLEPWCVCCVCIAALALVCGARHCAGDSDRWASVRSQTVYPYRMNSLWAYGPSSRSAAGAPTCPVRRSLLLVCVHVGVAVLALVRGARRCASSSDRWASVRSQTVHPYRMNSLWAYGRPSRSAAGAPTCPVRRSLLRVCVPVCVCPCADPGARGTSLCRRQ